MKMTKPVYGGRYLDEKEFAIKTKDFHGARISELKSTISRGPQQHHRKCFDRTVISPSYEKFFARPATSRIPVLTASSFNGEQRVQPHRGVWNGQRKPYAHVKAKIDTNRWRPRSASNLDENSLQKRLRGRTQDGKTADEPSSEGTPKNIKKNYCSLNVPDKFQIASQVAEIQYKNIEDPKKKALTTIAFPTEGVLKAHIQPDSGDARVMQQRQETKEKNSPQEISQLREELAILAEESKQLDKKYSAAMDKYEQEKAWVGQLVEQKTVMSKEIDKVKETVKVLQDKLNKLENKMKKMNIRSMFLEKQIKMKNLMLNIQKKSRKNFLNEEKENTELKSVLAKCNEVNCSLEANNKQLQEDLASTRAVLDQTVQERKELRENLAMNQQSLQETKAELETVKIDFSTFKNQSSEKTSAHDLSSETSKEDLKKQTENKNLEIKDLKANISHLEEKLNEKSMTENMLMSELISLQRQLVDNESTMRLKVKKLNFIMKGLIEEKIELEKVIAQKCLELSHKELIMQDELVESRRRGKTLILRQRKTYTQDFFKGRNENEMEKSRMFEFGKNFTQDSRLVDREFEICRDRVTELYSFLEEKQKEVTRLERRLLKQQQAQGKDQ